MNISNDKLDLLGKLKVGNAYIVRGEAGTGKTFAGVLCGQKLLNNKKPWQKVLYLTYSKLAKWQISDSIRKCKREGIFTDEFSKRMFVMNYHSLWWDLICQHYSFLGICQKPRLYLRSELEKITEKKRNEMQPEIEKLQKNTTDKKNSASFNGSEEINR